MAALTAIPNETGSMSPSSSPRLPSPPPFPEVQTAPRSPARQDDGPQLPQAPEGISRRIRPGTQASEMAKGPALVPLSELNSPFQLQEYLKALHHKETHDPQGNTKSLDHAAAVRLATPPEGVERSLWLYELCRLLIARVNSLIVGFFNDSPKCNAQNCAEMRASEWQYLCAVHDPPKSCCAIDYCCHTLDWATNIITSQKHFPSRLTLGGDGGASQQGIRQLTNIFRRVYRMFAHAWFQHREIFWKVEVEEGLYVFYKTVCDVYNLMPADTYTVPPEAEGLKAAEEAASAPRGESKRYTQDSQSSSQELPLRPKIDREGSVISVSEHAGIIPPPAPTSLASAPTTKRHKHTPSTGSFVPTITEGDEESEDRGGKQPLETTDEMSTVRYDPKDVKPVAPPAEASETVLDDSASEVTMIIDPPPEETTEAAVPEKAKEVKPQQSEKSEEKMESPVTPIEDEPSPEDERSEAASMAKSSALQSKDEPSEAKELTGGPEASKVSDVPKEQAAVAEEEKKAYEEKASEEPA